MIYIMFFKACGCRVSQQEISHGTDGSAAAVAQCQTTSLPPAYCSPRLLLPGWAESPLAPPCPLSYHREGSGNLEDTNTGSSCGHLSGDVKEAAGDETVVMVMPPDGDGQLFLAPPTSSNKTDHPRF